MPYSLSSTNHAGRQAVTVSSVFTALAGVVVCLRLYTRFFLVRYAGVEDYFIVVSILCSIALTICIGMQVHHGMGQHVWDLSESDMQSSLKAFWVSLIVYNLALNVTKASILVQYRRVFVTTKVRIATNILMVIIAIYALWTVFGNVFACYPVQAFWTRDPKATCLDQSGMWFSNAGINIFTDFALILLPMPVIQQLNLARRQKHALIAIFAIGGLVCIISIVRLSSLISISNSKDPTYDNPPAATWSSIETNIGIICSCLPCLRPLMGRLFPHVFSTSYRNGPSSTTPNHASRSQRRISKFKSWRSLNGIIMLPEKIRTADGSDERIQVTTTVNVEVEDKEYFQKDEGIIELQPRVSPKGTERLDTRLATRPYTKPDIRQDSTDTLVKTIGFA